MTRPLLPHLRSIIVLVRNLRDGAPSSLSAGINLILNEMKVAEQHVIDLQKELREVTDLVAEYEGKLTRRRVSEEETQYMGASFQRKPGGGYADTPTCPMCHGRMRSRSVNENFKCLARDCGHQADFHRGQLADVMADLLRDEDMNYHERR